MYHKKAQKNGLNPIQNWEIQVSERTIRSDI